jgi:hypothetical protein
MIPGDLLAGCCPGRRQPGGAAARASRPHRLRRAQSTSAQQNGAKQQIEGPLRPLYKSKTRSLQLIRDRFGESELFHSASRSGQQRGARGPPPLDQTGPVPAATGSLSAGSEPSQSPGCPAVASLP